MVGGTGRTSIIKITSQITSGNKSTASGRPQPQKLDEKGVLRRRLTSAALRRSRHNHEPRLDQMPLPAVTRATRPRTHARLHTDTQVLLGQEREEQNLRENTSLTDGGRLANTAKSRTSRVFTTGHTQGSMESVHYRARND